MVGILPTPVNFSNGIATGESGGMPDSWWQSVMPKPILQQGSGGILGGIFGDDPGASTQSGMGGMGYGPLSGSQKTALLFAGLRDAVNGFSGGQPSNYAGQQGEQFYRQNQQSSFKEAQSQIQAAMAKGDMQTVRQIAIGHPEIAASLKAAMELGQPKIEQVDSTRDTVSTDPMTGQRTVLTKGVPKPERLPDSVQIAQQLFPNDPQKQNEYLQKNSPANLRSITNFNAPKQNWQILTDPKAGTQYRYDVDSGKALTLDGQPYTPAGASKISGGGMGRSQGAMVMQKYMEEHPDATSDDIARLATSFKTGQSEAGTVGTRAGAADVSAREVSVFAKQALEASTNLPRTNYEAMNAALQSWDTKTSNPQLRRLMIASDALVNARARAISPTGSPHVNDQLEGRKMLSAAFANGDYAAAVSQMQMEADGVLSSTKASKDALLQHDDKKPQTSPQSLPRLPNASQPKIRKYNPATGRLE